MVFEVLQREKCKEKVPGMAQLTCVILGFSALMLVEILGKQECVCVCVKDVTSIARIL